MEVIKLAITVARNFIGTLEDPKDSNRGVKIDMIQKTFGFTGVQYCVLFVLYCYKFACERQRINYPFPKTASSQSLYQWALEKGYIETDFSKLKHGDIVIWRKLLTWQGHAAIVESIAPDRSAFTSIEGNTQNSDEGDQREGGGIFRRVRYMRKIDFKVDSFYLRGFIDVRKIFTEVLDLQFKSMADVQSSAKPEDLLT